MNRAFGTIEAGHRPLWVPVTAFLLLAGADPSRAGCEGGSWEFLGGLNTPRQEVGAAAIGETIYIVGGLIPDSLEHATNTVEAYDAVHNQWSFVAPMPAALDHMAVATWDSSLYVIGGYSSDFVPRAAVWIYRAASNQWVAGPSLPEARGAAWAATRGDSLFVFGGMGPGYIVQSSTWILALNSGQWTRGTDMPTEREHLNAVTVGAFIHVIGGRSGAIATHAHERYDPTHDTWQTLAALPTARSAAAVAPLGGRIYVMGGEVPLLHAVNEVYDVATNTWTCLAPMAVPRHGIAAVALVDRILTPGGGTIQGLRPTNLVDSFIPPPLAIQPSTWTHAKSAFR